MGRTKKQPRFFSETGLLKEDEPISSSFLFSFLPYVCVIPELCRENMFNDIVHWRIVSTALLLPAASYIIFPPATHSVNVENFPTTYFISVGTPPHSFLSSGGHKSHFTYSISSSKTTPNFFLMIFFTFCTSKTTSLAFPLPRFTM